MFLGNRKWTWKLILLSKSCIVIHSQKWHGISLREKLPKALKVICLFSSHTDLQAGTGVFKPIKSFGRFANHYVHPVFQRSRKKENDIGQLAMWNLVIFVELSSHRHVFTFLKFLTKSSVYLFFKVHTWSKGSPTPIIPSVVCMYCAF